MRNRALLRRLTVIEGKSHEAAAAIERERRLAEERAISPEEATRAYRQLMVGVSHDSAHGEFPADPAEAMKVYKRIMDGEPIIEASWRRSLSTR